MAKNKETSPIYIKNQVIVNYVPADFRKSKLMELFEPFGPVIKMEPFHDDIEEIIEVGFCLVTLSGEEQASRSIKALNGLRLQNKILKVSFARDMSSNPTNLYVTNLPLDMEEKDVVHLFERYGNIINLRVIYETVLKYGTPPPETLTINTGKAFVLYNEETECQNAYSNLNGMIFKEYGKHKMLKVWKCKKSMWSGKRDVFISNLPPFIGEAELMRGFSVNGSVLKVKILRHPVTNQLLRRGFIKMRSHDDAVNIIRQLNGTRYYGMKYKLYVSFARTSVNYELNY